MRSRVLFALLLMFVAVAAFAATTVRGKVVAADGSPYPSAEVTVVGKNQTVYTDSEGEFFIPKLEPGDYTITVKTSRSTTTHAIKALAQPVTEVRVVVK